MHIAVGENRGQGEEIPLPVIVADQGQDDPITRTPLCFIGLGSLSGEEDRPCDQVDCVRREIGAFFRRNERNEHLRVDPETECFLPGRPTLSLMQPIRESDR